MKNKSTFKEKYWLSISEYMTLKDIQKLCDCGQSAASRIRKDAIDYCDQNHIVLISRFVPTSAILEVIHKNIEYYYSKMELENRVNNERR